MSESKATFLTVSQLNEFIKGMVDASPILKSINLRGEISNFTFHRTGHMYFTLKDEGGVVGAVMFSQHNSRLAFLPENGMKVIVHGRVSVFVKSGQYQIYVDNMEPDGIGALYVAFEQLKRKLASEGLFEESRKRKLPSIPSRVGVVTSPTGAAVRDIINIIGRRFPYAEIVLYPALVQGDGAPEEIVAGIQHFSLTRSVDVLIVGRGGGSIEDLWAFNDERVARAVFTCSVPVISAVGHETDFTICDFVADKRAPTPSAAAELAVPDTPELQKKFHNVTARMLLLLERNAKMKRQRLQMLTENRVMVSPQVLLDEKRMAVLADTKQLDTAIRWIFSQKRGDFISRTAKLEALNPMSVISRGYSAVYLENQDLVKSVKQIQKGDRFYFCVSDGRVTGTVEEVKEAE